MRWSNGNRFRQRLLEGQNPSRGVVQSSQITTTYMAAEIQSDNNTGETRRQLMIIVAGKHG